MTRGYAHAPAPETACDTGGPAGASARGEPRAGAPAAEPEAPAESVVESYRRLADVFHDVLSEQSLDALLDRIADARRR